MIAGMLLGKGIMVQRTMTIVRDTEIAFCEFWKIWHRLQNQAMPAKSAGKQKLTEKLVRALQQPTGVGKGGVCLGGGALCSP